MDRLMKEQIKKELHSELERSLFQETGECIKVDGEEYVKIPLTDLVDGRSELYAALNYLFQIETRITAINVANPSISLDIEEIEELLRGMAKNLLVATGLIMPKPEEVS